MLPFTFPMFNKVLIESSIYKLYIIYAKLYLYIHTHQYILF